MATLSDVVNAIQALGSQIGGSSGQAAVTPSAVTGTLSVEGAFPVFTLTNVADPKDLVRVSAVLTVDVQARREPILGSRMDWETGTESPTTVTWANTWVRKVYTIDAVGGVNANGRKVGLPPLPMSVAGTGAGGYFDVGSCSLVSSTLQLATRYHYG